MGTNANCFSNAFSIVVNLHTDVVSRGINRLVGTSGASVISRVMGLILTSVATTNILTGLSEYYKVI